MGQRVYGLIDSEKYINYDMAVVNPKTSSDRFALDLHSGMFRVPVDGIYYFSFSGLKAKLHYDPSRQYGVDQYKRRLNASSSFDIRVQLRVRNATNCSWRGRNVSEGMRNSQKPI